MLILDTLTVPQRLQINNNSTSMDAHNRTVSVGSVSVMSDQSVDDMALNLKTSVRSFPQRVKIAMYDLFCGCCYYDAQVMLKSKQIAKSWKNKIQDSTPWLGILMCVCLVAAALSLIGTDGWRVDCPFLFFCFVFNKNIKM